MKTLARMTSAVAVLGLTLSPVAVQAGTRAVDSPVTIDAGRASATAVDANELKGNIAWLILLLAAIAAIIAAGGGGGDNGRTRG